MAIFKIDNTQIPKNISTIYPNDGSPEYQGFHNKKGLKIFSYNWRVDNPKAIIVAIHGIQNHCRFEYLSHPYVSISSPKTSKNSSIQLCTYKGSWVEAFNRHDISFTGIDLQGHGFSEGWEGSRCNTEAFDDFSEDIISFLKTLINNENQVAQNSKYKNETYSYSSLPPIFLMGISLGGCLILRSIGLLSDPNHRNNSNENSFYSGDSSDVLKYLAGCIALSPMLSLENAKTQLAGRIFLNIAGFVSRHAPQLKIASVGRNTLYPYVDAAKRLDPLSSFPSRIPARLSNELLHGVDQTHIIAATFPINLSILIVHSKNDTLCEIQGSEKFFKNLPNKNKEIWKLDSFWHCLTHEEGNEMLAQDIINWIIKSLIKSSKL